MRRNRIGYILFTILLVCLFLFFPKPYLLLLIGLLVTVPAVVWLLLRLDVRSLQVEFVFQAGGVEGKRLPLAVSVHAARPLLVTRCVSVEFEVYNKMFDTREKRILQLEPGEAGQYFTVPFEARQCGEHTVRCVQVLVQDILNLFGERAAPFEEVSMTVYPRQLRVRAELSDTTVGPVQNDGLMQNRKGNDPSEMFDIRDYVPGDDVRTIHWKLSGKTDSLIVRQPSEPFHYQIALLPDFGLKQGTEDVSWEELNTAVALGNAICGQLIRQGVSFCALLPTAAGLQICEIRNNREWESFMTEWLSCRIQKQSGTGLQYFRLEHMEQSFTRLLILGTKEYSGELEGLENQIGILLIRAVKGRDNIYTESSGNYETIEVPTEHNDKKIYRIVC